MSFSNWAAGIVAAAAVLPGSAGAVVYYGTYMPSDTPATEKNAFIPLKHRSPDASQSFNAAASVSGYCANASCGYYIGNSVTTDFVAPTTFEAHRMIVPASIALPYGNRRVGFSISHYDDEADAWEGLGYMQLETGLLPQGVIKEVDAPFGVSGARFVDFNYQPITFEAGETYRISASAWAGGLGTFNWYLSDMAADPGQAVQYSAVQRPSGGAPTNLAFMPAFAFTDGGALVAPPPPTGAVPEPATWAMMILGFAGAGAALRRRRGLVLAGGDPGRETQ